MANTWPRVPVIRHKNRTDEDNPVSGSLQIIHVGPFSGAVTSTTYTRQIRLPLGATFRVVDAAVIAGAVTSDPAITIGTAAAGTQMVAAANVTTGMQHLTVKNTAADATVSGTATVGGTIFVQITNDGGDVFTDADVTLCGYMTAPPSSVYLRNTNHF